MLPNQRINVLFVLMIAVAFCLPINAIAQSESDDLNTSELKVDAVEPQIALPVVRKKRGSSLRVRTVSLGQRNESRDGLVRLAQEAVDTTARRLLSSDQHTPWQMMHALLGLRQEFNILHEGQEVSGLEWMAQGQVFDGDHWFEKTQHGGRAHPYSVPYAFEGHANQMLAVLSMCGLETDHQFETADGPVTIADMIEHAKATCDANRDEPTWTLWALSRYLPPDAAWRNENGEVWSIERLVGDQTKRPLNGAACGGTHGLFALAHARNVYLREGKPLRGVWLQAENKLRYYINTARRLQNSNGSLSSNYLRGRQYNPDFNKRMASAGHVLEFLMLALPQNELNQRWVRRAVEATARDLLNNRKEYVKCSPLYHSVNALNIYLDRVNPRADIPQTAEVESPRTAMVSPQEDRSEIPTQGISQSRTMDNQEGPGAEDAPEASKVTQDPEASKPTEPSKSIEDAPAPLPTTSSAAEAAANKEAAEQQQTIEDSEPPLTGPTGNRSEHKIDRSVIDELVQQKLNELDAKDDGQWKSTSPNRTATREATEVDGVEEQEQIKSPKADVPSDGAEEAAGLIELKPVDSDATPLRMIVPEASSEEGELESTPHVPASSLAPLMAKEKPATDADDKSAVVSTEMEQQNQPVVAERTMLPSRLHTGARQSNPFSIERRVSRTPLSIPTTTVSQSRTLAREEVTADSQTPTDEISDAGISKEKSSGNQKTRVQTTDDPKSREIQATEFPTVPAGINDRFLDPELNPDEWVNRFEVESREIYACRDQIVKAIDLSEGQTIADIGAGTGLFTGLFSKSVGAEGKVYAIDISPRLIAHLEQRVAEEKLSNVVVVRNDATSTQLVTQKVDRAFVCDTYHHFERPDAMLKSIHRSMNDGGELVVIDFERIPGHSRDWVIGHVRAGKDTFRAEIEASGFDFVKEVKVDGFEENYLLIFRRK